MRAGKPVESLILTVRDQKVILDSELAKLYGTTTKALNQAVKRNIDRFPIDFMFNLSAEEWREVLGNRSQIVTGSDKHRIHGFVRTPSPSMAQSWPHRF
jgi:hypothetical protein